MSSNCHGRVLIRRMKKNTEKLFVKAPKATGAKLPDPIGQALTLAARRHRSRMAAHLSSIGLFPGQDQVLRALVHSDGLTMGEIATLLNIRPPTASKMVARMGIEGLIERRSKGDDARLVAVFITPEGQTRSADINSIAKRIEKEALAGMDDKDMRRLRKLLKKVAKNMGASDDQSADDEDDLEASRSAVD
jgi:MarR family transcriptional regulator, organic hydroperoxide resistance regulator